MVESHTTFDTGGESEAPTTLEQEFEARLDELNEVPTNLSGGSVDVQAQLDRLQVGFSSPDLYALDPETVEESLHLIDEIREIDRRTSELERALEDSGAAAKDEQ